MSVTILTGIPGCGKTTYIKKNHAKAKVFSADDFWIVDGKYAFDRKRIGDAHASCLRRFTETLLMSDPIAELVVDNTNISVAELAPYAALGKAYGHEVQIVTILEDPYKAYKRCTHGVGLKDILSMDLRLRGGIPHMPAFWSHVVLLAEDLMLKKTAKKSGKKVKSRKV